MYAAFISFYMFCDRTSVHVINTMTRLSDLCIDLCMQAGVAGAMAGHLVHVHGVCAAESERAADWRPALCRDLPPCGPGKHAASLNHMHEPLEHHVRLVVWPRMLCDFVRRAQDLPVSEDDIPNVTQQQPADCFQALISDRCHPICPGQVRRQQRGMQRFALLL